MAMNLGGLNPSQQQVAAMNTTAQYIASLKGKDISKETGVKEEPPELHQEHIGHDEVTLSAMPQESEQAQAFEQEQAAENSGDLSADLQAKRRNLSDSDRAEEGEAMASHLAARERKADITVFDLGSGTPDGFEATSVDALDRRTPDQVREQVLGDVPPEIANVAKDMVVGQVKGNQPAASLVELKNVEGTAALAPPESHLAEPMGIHDTANQPLQLELEHVG